MLSRIVRGVAHGAVVVLGAILLGLGWKTGLVLGAIPVVCGMLNIFVGDSLYWSAVFGIVAVLWWVLPLQRMTDAVFGKDVEARLAKLRDDVEIKMGILPEKPIAPPPAEAKTP